MGRDGDGADEEEAHAEAETDALGEEEVPDEVGKGGADQRRGFKGDADEEGGPCTIFASRDGSDWRYQQGTGD